MSFVLQKKRRLGDSNCAKMSPQWVCSVSSHGFCEVLEQAALSPAHCGGLSPGPFPLCRLTDSVAAACLWKPMAQQLCDRDYTSSAHWLLAVLTVPPPLPFIYPPGRVQCIHLNVDANKLRSSTCTNSD